MLRLSIAVILTLVSLLARATNAQQTTVQVGVSANQKEIEVLGFEDMRYPPLAQYAPFQSEGVVVVQVSLAEDGSVADATAISGNFVLIPETLANVRRWKFKSSGSKNAIVVYNFRTIRGDCRVASSLFTFLHPNFVTVLGCLPATDAWVKIVPIPRAGTISDSDIQVVHFDSDLKYPPLARVAKIEGVVLVQAKLDDDGRVKEALPIYGNALLSSECVANAKKWHFHPNSARKAVLVYDFRLTGENEGGVSVKLPNFITIRDITSVVQP